MTAKDAAGALPRKSIDCEFKSLEDNGTFSMYVLVFGNIDRQLDLIERGAVTNIPELVKDGYVAINHRGSDLPVAMITSASQDDHGLLLNGTFHSTPEAQACRTVVKERLEAKKSVKTSIAYFVPVDGERYEKIDGQTVRVISKMAVYEGSFVNLPANPRAEVLSAKSATHIDGLEAERENLVTEQAILKAFKQVFGLSGKAGRKMSAETLDQMKSFAEGVEDHAEKCFAHAKSLKGIADEHKTLAGEFKKCLKNFEGGQQQAVAEGNDGNDVGSARGSKTADQDDEQDEDGDDDEEQEKPPRGKGKKPKPKPPADDDEGEDDDEEKTRKAYLAVLKRRALTGRGSAVCP